MNTKAILIFLAGVACGAGGMFLALKNKYQTAYNEAINAQIANEKKADAVKTDIQQAPANAQPGKNDIPVVSTYQTKFTKPEPEELLKQIEEAEGIAVNSGYIQKEDIQKVKNFPYVISPDEAGEIPGYEQIDLKYFADGILTNEDDEIIENYQDLVGDEALHSFGEYEADAVYVRNDIRKIDFCILREFRSFYPE